MLEIARRCCWLVVVLAFCACVALKLNGSSVGIWDKELNGAQRSRGLLLFQPQQIRTDEWMIWTPAALAQAHHTPSFAVENLSLGAGHAPLLMNLPVAYYTTLFRPQLWGFFLFDFERGFSFCWCCKVFGALFAVAWLLREIGVRSRGLVLFGTLWFFFSGFTQWWFSTPAMLPEMVTSWAICSGCAIQFFKQTIRWRIAIAFGGFVFCGVNLVLCLYPPFQIPLLYLMAAIVMGAVWEGKLNGHTCSLKRGSLLILAAIATTALVLLPFWIDMRATFQLVSQTVYPGARRSTGGGLSPIDLFSDLVAFFQTEKTLPAGVQNICEASNFYPLWPAVIVALVVACWRNRVAISPLFIALIVVIVFFAFYCLVPLPSVIARATLLSFTTERRGFLAIGLANIFLVCLFLDRFRFHTFTKSVAIVMIVGFSTAIAVLLFTAYLHKPGFFPDRTQLVFASSADAIVLALFFWGKARVWLPSTLIALLIFTNGGINPVMLGLSPLVDSEAFTTIEKMKEADPSSKWVAYHDLLLAQLVQATGAPILNATKIVPDLGFLRRLDPTGSGNFVYNRYAHIVCELPGVPDQVGAHLVLADTYVLDLPPGLPILRELGYRYMTFPEEWPDANSHGFALIQEIKNSGIWIYRQQVQDRQ